MRDDEEPSGSGARRLFLALEIPTAVRTELGRLVQEMRPLESGVRYVSEQNMHLTLKFLGNVQEEVVCLVATAAGEAVRSFAPFEFRVSGLGVFPQETRPRVVWAGIHDSGEMLAIQAKLEEALGALGFPKEERPFRAHLTIGRVKVPAKMPGLMRWLDRNRHREFGEGRGEDIVLFESKLRSDGPLYTTVERIPLAGG